VEGFSVYEGDFFGGMKDGKGKIKWRDGRKYKGEFKENKMSGYGVYEKPGEFRY
jgi:hypothetical protein